MLDLDIDVRPHPLDDVLHDHLLPKLGIQVEIQNDAFQSGTAQDLLLD